jgi:tripartite-type tricarboxylate transporter receptor subunit TctC
VPPISQSGLPGFSAVTHYGLAAPPGTPRAIVERLNKALNNALADSEVRKHIIEQGGEPEPGTPEHQAQVIDREEIKWSKIIHAAGLNPK